MNKITFPLQVQMQGPNVGDLQIALQFLLDRGIMGWDDESVRRERPAAFTQEHAEQTFGKATQELVNIFQQAWRLEASGAVDEPTANALNRLLEEMNAVEEGPFPYLVKGTVRFFDGFPAAGILISAFDRDLRHEQLLGQTQTNRKGAYQIHYAERQFQSVEKGSADLVVKASTVEGALLVASPVVFNAPLIAEVDLTIPAEALQAPTLFERIKQALQPLLERVKVEELEEDKEHQDLTFLAGETGFARPVLARFVLAHRLVQQNLPAEFWFVLLGGSLYPFIEGQPLKEQLALVFDGLPKLNAAAVSKAFSRGFNQKEIAESFHQNLEAWLEAFLELINNRLLTGEGKPTFVKAALEDAHITDTQKQITFASLFNEYKALTPELLGILEKDTRFKKEEIAALRTSFALSELTQGEFSVVKMIKDAFGIRQPDQIRTLAKRSEDEWVTLVQAKYTAGDITLPFELKPIDDQVLPPQADVYGKMLERRFREAFPTMAFTGSLERALNNGGVKGLQQPQVLDQFLHLHENFELLSTSVDDFLKNSVHPDFQTIAQDETFKRELKAVQRVFKLAPTFAATDVLLADDLHCAQKIYRLGQSEFVRRYEKQAGFTPETARLAWNRAADTHAAVLTVVADLKALDPQTLPEALKNNDEALLTFPNWENLFKMGDLCECEHCRSVLSPAAYFADLLMFLRDRKAKNPANTSKDILLNRRADLGFLELNCANALTTLPYIDVVCEVLENAVDTNNDNDLVLTGFTVMPANPAAAKTELAQAFNRAFTDQTNDNKEKVDLGADFSLSQVSPSDADRWVVHADNVSYLLKKKPPLAHFFAEILPNTKASAAELRAYPQYVNPKAYAKLRMAKYPLSLPFDLFGEEVRAAFQKTNLQRWDLMHTLTGPTAPNNPTDGEVAAEYFGISADQDADFDEKSLILKADPTVDAQKTIWGETGASWLNKVGNVKNFLQKTGLEYNELLGLLDLQFINPAGDITIHHLDPSCDTNQKIIQVLDEAKLDRIHRFLRLWRKLKSWKMWELDLVIRHPSLGNGALDEPFLIKLFYVSRLKNRLGGKTTVEQVCALFGNLNTETRFIKLHEKREEGLYQNLFLNRRLINPLDPAFQLDPSTNDLLTGELLTAHHPVILAALGIREADLTVLEELTAPDDTRYITSELTLGNLSFLWRHAWLSKQLKFKVEEWKILLKIFQQNHLSFTDPAAAWTFIEKIDHLNTTDFTPDELNWLLTADQSAKAAVKVGDAARFLTALRKDLQAIQAEYDPAQYAFLSSPNDVVSLTTLLTSLLQKLNRDDIGVDIFLKTLRGPVLLEAAVQGLPAGFTFPAAITGAPNYIPIRYESVLQFSGVMTVAQRATLLSDALPAEVTSHIDYINAIEDLFQQSQVANDHFVTLEVNAILPNGLTLPDTLPSLPIRYNTTTQKLSFTGVMTDAERLVLNATHTLDADGNTTRAFDELFRLPRLAVKFYRPVFTAPLEDLPLFIDFKSQLPSELAAKISYDVEQRLLRFAGIMRETEQLALKVLAPSTELAYRNAVDSLATQPQHIARPDERIWLMDDDLDLTPSANNTLATRLANTVRKALDYLSTTLTAHTVIQQSSAQLGLTEALTRCLLEDFPVMPPILSTRQKVSLLAHFTRVFALTTSVVDYLSPAMKLTFDGWFWANRAAKILKQWKLTLADLKKITALTAGAQLLDLTALPLDDRGAIAPIDRFLRTSRLLRMRDSLPETKITFLEVLEKLDKSTYATAADFAADVERLNEAWFAADVKALTDSLELTYPTDYLLVESWERLRRAFYFLDNLNAGADTAKTFAAATMNATHAKSLKELLRSKFGTETWLILSAEIQDVLRERKRDALAAYLLAQPQPNDAPSDKWENTNDLYAYYLLDVDMSACQLTSRLVQGAGSIQLFVQRCFMGLEQNVVVKANGDDSDSAWSWWKWMRKYRVWEANRKVFLWPENWIEPELKKDRSPFFKDLENELLQNDINQYTVETAFSNYLEKLDSVAQLDIAGFYQEDDGDQAILHVFGRTTGTEPHLYYYRRYDYRQWTPWEKVDLDIQSDYLIPFVINKRLFLFWPVFTEIPDELANSELIPIPRSGETSAPLKKAKKLLKLQLAVSDYRQGKWTPKKISTDFKKSYPYDVEIVKKHYLFIPVDRSQIDGRFGIQYTGYSLGSDGNIQAYLSGAFEIAGCQGVPVLNPELSNYHLPTSRPDYVATGYYPSFAKWTELGKADEFGRYEPRYDAPKNDFTLVNLDPYVSSYLRITSVLVQTPGFFNITPPWHPSYLDRFLIDLPVEMRGSFPQSDRYPLLVGSWLPFFYNDKKHTFFVLPLLWWGDKKDRLLDVGKSIRYYYPDIKKDFRQVEDFIAGQIHTWLDSITLPRNGSNERQQLEQFLWQGFPEEAPPPYSDEQVKNLLQRYFMRFVHYDLSVWSLYRFQFRQLHFKNFYHPFVCEFAKLAYNPLKGIPALMERTTQLKESGFSFKQVYQPTNAVVKLPPQYPSLPDCLPREDVDFTPDGAYSSYNWELFFHAPLLIANALSKNQRFEEARNWYHFIFNPLGVESGMPGGSRMSKYWITKPFFATTSQQYVQQRIDHILRMLAGDPSVQGFSAQAKKDLEDQVLDWRTNPFEPHRIANYRTVAYQKTVVMKYLDNLIAWGDSLFRQDSMESINEATQLYVLAAEILGPRPKKIPPQVKPPLESFNELEAQFDEFSNALVEVENLLPQFSGNGPDGVDPAPLPMLYFCLPPNDKMLSYWDTVADRLYKIRHCMNIEGVVRQLALFEPPIDPGALVKAAAAGLDISSVLADMNAPLPLYRFNVLLQKTNEVCNDVKALGGALLAALEKKDAEALGLLRQTLEIRLLEAVAIVHEKQIEEAKENLAGIKKSKELAVIKQQYYESREFMNAAETVAIALNTASTLLDIPVSVGYITSGVLKAIPDFLIGASGFGGSPHATVQMGGASFGDTAKFAAEGLAHIAQNLDKMAALSSTVATYQRRQDDWDLQRDLALKEIEQLDKSIAAAELRITLAEKELENHTLQIENAKTTDAFMRSKYTNQELYQWQVGQISGVYFQSYQLAYDLAKQAERCFRFEVGVQQSSYVNFGYWDSLKKGLLSGEKLQYDLRRLETAYLEQNRREFELTKHLSLALLDPLALVKLKETGRCFINLPEEIFDLDFPGHYFRRIKSVSITLPCVVGPYTTISCTLRLLKNSIRINTANGDNGYPRNTDDQGLPADDSRFIENNIPVKAIAVSGAQNDSGVFELNFRDERYLPFEGAGAISAWSLELFNDLPANNPDPGNPDFGKPLRQFDYSTISDTILHVKYTAREDAGPFKNGAITHLRGYFSEDNTSRSVRLFNLRQEFPTQWHRFLHPTNPANGNIFELEMSPSLFRIVDKGKTLKINTIWLLARCTDSRNYTIVMTPPLPVPPPPDANLLTLARAKQYGGLHFSQKNIAELSPPVQIVPTDPPVKWQLKMTRYDGGDLQEDPVKKVSEVEEVFLIVGYEWHAP
jgi:hypothetical protein